ncbi:aldo/keto reductase [Flavobacterium selenitireducens]|uniref:aldo/keto reductase n=1 Tax=Flavobacterium selenitireducens TaxID=2722704 RepID=UPI00168AD86A|nr:aldo/keto reductase [Flavobacterium selenitireducens]MBD3582653.1 aldo/keto reductase [Flavobacterium selenitireducens]
MATLKKLGSQGLEVPAMGLGCMGMSGFQGGDMYGKTDDTESIATIHESLEKGFNFLDTADMYGPFHNERLIGKAIKGNRQKYIIATKFGWEIDDATNTLTWQINGKPDYVRHAVERSLKNLGTDHIDLYYLHRRDKTIPIEETIGAMADLVREGKVSYIGLSEVSSENVRRAHAVHPLTAVQSEYSLFERRVEQAGVTQTLETLGIGLVAYSPLGRGFITGQFKSIDDLPKDDFRRNIPKFRGEHFQKNLDLLAEIEKMASGKGVKPSQLAIAWTIAKGAVPIPGTKRRKYLAENLESASLELSSSDIERLERIIPITADTGNSYWDEVMQYQDY